MTNTQDTKIRSILSYVWDASPHNKDKYMDDAVASINEEIENARKEERERIVEWAKEQRRVWVKGIEHADLVSEYNDCLDDIITHLTT